MRRRLLRTFIGVALFAVVVLGVPLALIGRQSVRNDALRSADREADAVGFAVQGYLQRGEAIPANVVAPFVDRGRYVQITDASGATETFGAPRTDEDVVASITLADGSQIVVHLPDSVRDRRELVVVLVVAGLAAASVALAALLGALLARRLSRPLDELATTSRRLGDGDFSARARATGLEEVDQVGAALNGGAERIGAMVAAEREFSANASHQLRTPLTALRLRLEEIVDIGSEPVVAEAHLALQQADRLDATITELLKLARPESTRPSAPIDVAALLREHVPAWRHLCAARGRTFEADVAAPCQAFTTTGGTLQVVQTLVENALDHGDGTISLRAAPANDVVVVTVSDEGRGLDAASAARIFERHVSTKEGAGVGLALARTLAEADGGRLDLVSTRPTTFQLRAPAPLAVPDFAEP
jgi:signal transduction histidine kinase